MQVISGLITDLGCRICAALKTDPEGIMIKLNRVTEYALIALRHMNRKAVVDARSVTSAREIADQYGLPFEITAKTLQRLRDTGLIDSAQGARGGYLLQSDLNQISLAQFLDLMEGGQSVVACAPVEHPSHAPTSTKQKDDCHCEYHSACEIQGVMKGLNRRIREFLSGIRLAELTQDSTLNLVQITSLAATASGGTTTAGARQAQQKWEPSS